MKQTTLQYLAGIIDSEGYFRLRKFSNRTSLGSNFKLDTTCKEVIELFCKTFQCKYKTQNRGVNRKVIYTVSIEKTNLKSFIESIIPFLNEKYSSANICLEYINLSPKIQKEKSDEYYKRYIKERYLSKRDIIFSYAYMAGILDGDGYICVSRQKTNKLLIKFGLEQCFKELPYYLKQTFGGNIQVRSPKKEEHRISYVWNAKIKEAKEICEKCFPFLIEKKDRVKILLSIIELKSNIYKIQDLEKYKIFQKYKNTVNQSIEK